MVISLGIFFELSWDGKAVEQRLCTGKAEQSQYVFGDRKVLERGSLGSRTVSFTPRFSEVLSGHLILLIVSTVFGSKAVETAASHHTRSGTSLKRGVN